MSSGDRRYWVPAFAGTTGGLRPATVISTLGQPPIVIPAKAGTHPCATQAIGSVRSRGLRALLRVSLALVFTSSVAIAKPYIPTDDTVVLERLPERTEPSLRELKRMRATLAVNPRDLDAATAVAQRAIEASRANGDPRFLGQAQAALAPWWNSKDPPPRALLLRATIRQSQHDFDGALADLDRLIASDPRAAQARLVRATVRTVVGRYAEAQSDCRALAPLAPPLIVAGCLAGPTSLSGDAAAAYDVLTSALARPGGDAGAVEWALTLAGEIAARSGRAADAERHFRQALLLDPRDAYLRAAYADFLLDAGRARDALRVTGDDLRNDTLLLRAVLAERLLDDHRAAYSAHRAEMEARFDAARLRGDSLHRREEARFRLWVDGDNRGALALARDNWKVQREPADLRILVDAARAANDAEAMHIATEWMAQTRMQDVALVTAMGAPR